MLVQQLDEHQWVEAYLPEEVRKRNPRARAVVLFVYRQRVAVGNVAAAGASRGEETRHQWGVNVLSPGSAVPSDLEVGNRWEVAAHVKFG